MARTFRSCTTAAVLVLAACSGSDSSPLGISIIDPSKTNNLDAAELAPAAEYLRAATSQGLVRLDSLGNIVPALAERWIVTADGLSYIFRLRNARWENGDTVTSEHVAAALRRRLEIERRTAIGADTTEVRDIRAMTGRVIEIRLLAPQPELLRILTLPELGIRRNGRGTGPLVANRQQYWTLLSDRVDDAVSPDSRRAVRPLQVRTENAARAIARFSMGETSVVLGGKFQHLPYLSAGAVPDNAVRADPVIGLFGLLVINGQGFLSDPANREVVALAIDRDALMNPLGLRGWQTMTRIVPSGLDRYAPLVSDRWTGLTLDERRERARGQVARWLQDQEKLPELRIAMPPGPGSRLVFGRLKRDLAMVGITGVMVGAKEKADLRLIDEVAHYRQPSWFLNQLSCVVRPVCDEAGDVLLAQAKRMSDPAARAQKMAEAEVSITTSNIFIPLGAPVRFSLVSGNVPGFAITADGWHALPDMVVIPR
ncbi:ABC transporter substrate-binding protein [Blastomonas sp.]|uniref:ABC transporter substrate-binding protein n=1 Tax=Blastomonas sp. TaxID=1909299 RepID=UPI00262E9A02|nr:ABC transporter substrate-binding protein [Blastomonas sp.]MDM7957378.1 ABC transporter substrate-binding protein [Blastomonas sp.]